MTPLNDKRSALLYFHPYKYLPYEKDFAIREIEGLIKPDSIARTGDGYKINGRLASSVLDRLVYFSEYSFDGKDSRTLQSRLEKTLGSFQGRRNRQATRYSVHGLHEYKGKFNPQIVRGIINMLGVRKGARILDPFCGSGTSLVESAYAGTQAVGFDINPLAVFVSNAKLQSLGTSASKLDRNLECILNRFRKFREVDADVLEETERIIYLSKWFDTEVLSEIELLRNVILSVQDTTQNVWLAIASNILRDYSLQEPADLRIRRRKTPLPEVPLIRAFEYNARRFLKQLYSAQSITDLIKTENIAHLHDNRALHKNDGRELFNAAITSPPYATALPYIDTQRLSLVWLELCEHSKLNLLEARLTGSREFTGQAKAAWNSRMNANEDSLPSSAHGFCVKLQDALGESDGFRRRVMPPLLYRYLVSMRDSFREVLPALNKGAPYALLIGHNTTTLGGTVFHIETPGLLRDVACSVGWIFQESVPLQTYQRYGLHKDNSVKMETLLILRKR